MEHQTGGACCAAATTGTGGHGMYPFSIVKRTVRGQAGFEAEWYPTRCRRRFTSKGEATAFVKAHEAMAWGPK